MIDNRPPPFTTKDINLTGFTAFQLHVDRLFGSELWQVATGDEFKAAIGLWGRAWQQSPPGSLPNDDRVLAGFSGAGNRWRKVKGIALRGFIECSDGRLYHKVLCEDVMRAWASRLMNTNRTEAARAAREAQRRLRDNVCDNVCDRSSDNACNMLPGEGEGEVERGRGEVNPPTPADVTEAPTPDSEAATRKQLLGLLTGHGVKLRMGNEEIFHEWAALLGQYAIAEIQRALADPKRPDLPSKILPILERNRKRDTESRRVSAPKPKPLTDEERKANAAHFAAIMDEKKLGTTHANPEPVIAP